mgnify:CR=1 FL=1
MRRGDEEEGESGVELGRVRWWRVGCGWCLSSWSWSTALLELAEEREGAKACRPSLAPPPDLIPRTLLPRTSTSMAEDLLQPPVQDSVPLPPVAQPSADRPDAHTARFDRQLRLWAKSGQQALEDAHVLVVGANATAASTLKNLVLPSELPPLAFSLPPPPHLVLLGHSPRTLPRLADVGQFTILDPATVTEADIGCNFFLDPSSLGKPRAEQVVRFLLELNGDVKGHALVQVRSLALFLFIS